MKTSVWVFALLLLLCFFLGRHFDILGQDQGASTKISLDLPKQRSIASVSLGGIAANEKNKFSLPNKSARPDSRPEFPTRAQIEEAIRNDDYCAIMKFQKSAYHEGIEYTPFDMTEEIYFEMSSFRRQYEDYKAALELKGAETPVGQLYENLNRAGYLDGVKKNPYPRQIETAQQGFRTMALNDPGNAAPLIFELALSQSKSDQELEPLINEILSAKRFDSYLSDFVKESHDQDESHVTGFMVRSNFFSKLPIPNFYKISQELKKRFSNRPDLIDKMGWLLAQQGLDAKKPSWTASYSVFEYSIGRSMLKPSMTLPDFQKLDQAMNYVPLNVDFDLLSDLTGSCTPAKLEKAREYVRKLQADGFEFNL